MGSKFRGIGSKFRHIESKFRDTGSKFKIIKWQKKGRFQGVKKSDFKEYKKIVKAYLITSSNI